MKKIDLVHTTILIIALLAGYSALQQVFVILSVLGFAIGFDMPGTLAQPIFFAILSLIFLSTTCLILIWRGMNLASLIIKNEPEGSDEGNAQLQLDRRNIIFVLFLGMGLQSLIQSVPYLVRDLYEMFRNRVATDLFRGPKPDARTVVVEALKVLLGVFLIYAAAPLTNFIDRHIASKLKSDS